MTKLFVTGSESFIGKELLAQCKERGLDSFAVDLHAPNTADRASADIRNPAIVDLIPEGTTSLVHLAAISRDPDCRANPRLAYDVNIMGTVNLIEAAKSRGVNQFIFASSEWVYGEVANGEVQTEDRPIDVTKLTSEYALSKVMGEQLLKLAHNAGLPAVTILRFGIVYGPRAANWSALESLLHKTYKREAIQVGSLATARRFIHVRDVASGILASIGKEGCNTFNLSGDAPVSLREIIREGVGICGNGFPVEESAPNSTSIRNPDNTLAKSALDWAPRVELQQGVKEIISYFEHEGSN